MSKAYESLRHVNKRQATSARDSIALHILTDPLTSLSEREKERRRERERMRGEWLRARERGERETREEREREREEKEREKEREKEEEERGGKEEEGEKGREKGEGRDRERKCGVSTWEGVDEDVFITPSVRYYCIQHTLSEQVALFGNISKRDSQFSSLGYAHHDVS